VGKVLEIKDLNKRYGKIHAVDNLSLDVEEGQVFGILGPNGSGKTTTLGIVLDVINSDGGNFAWFGEPPTKEVRKSIGAVLETPIFYPYLSGHRNLEIVARIKGVEFSRIDEVLQQVGLFERKDYNFRTYSLGMKQRLSIASALLCKPRAMILDEPTNGLDPQGIAEIRQLILDIAADGKTIILASHLLDEVQKVCTHFAVLKSGKKIYQGEVGDVGSRQVVEVTSTDPQLKPSLENFELKQSIRAIPGGFEVELLEGVDASELNKYLVQQNIVVSGLSTHKKSLEQQFLEILKENQ